MEDSAAVAEAAEVVVPPAAGKKKRNVMIKPGKLFTQEEQEKIKAAVAAVESQTSGEVVPMIVAASSEYQHVEWFGAGVVALAFGLTASWVFGSGSILWFFPVYVIVFVFFFFFLRYCLPLKRSMLHRDEMAAKVHQKALVSFLEQGVHETRDRTGILLFISLFERRVEVLADSGINSKVTPQDWEEVVAIITRGLRDGKGCDSVVSAIHCCTDMLRKHFPRADDDTNELPDLVIGE